MLKIELKKEEAKTKAPAAISQFVWCFAELMKVVHFLVAAINLMDIL